MSKKILYLILVIVIAIVSFIRCNDSLLSEPFVPGDDNSNGKSGCTGIVISESQYNSAETDEYIVNKANITGDSLMIEIQYGGGCGPVGYELYTDGLFMESNPVQLNILLAFADDDPCEMVVKKNLCFDLSDLASYYNDSYQSTGGTIILRIQDFNNLTYNF